jgi:hypothetical protein
MLIVFMLQEAWGPQSPLNDRQCCHEALWVEAKTHPTSWVRTLALLLITSVTQGKIFNCCVSSPSAIEWDDSNSYLKVCLRTK